MIENNLLEKILKNKQISVSELARRAGVSRTTLTDLIKSRKTNLTVSKAEKISAALGCSVAEVFPGVRQRKDLKRK